LAFIVSTAKARATVTTDGIDLIDEDDARSVFFALFKQVTNPRSAHADEHLHEIGTRDRKERNARFTRDRSRQQSFSGARRAHDQNGLWDASSQAGELLRILQKCDDLFELNLGFFRAGDIFESDAVLVLGQQPRLALSKGHGFAAAHLDLAHKQ